MNYKKLLFISVLALSLSGCGKMSAVQVAVEDVNNGKMDKTDERPACEIQRVEYTLDTKMIGFELTNSFGINAGFNLISGFMKLLSLDFKAKGGRMDMEFSLSNPMAPDYELLSVLGKGKFSSWGVALDLGFQNIGGGFSFYNQTPLAELAKKTLKDSFKNMNKQVAGLQDAWSTQVVAIPNDDYVIIPVGSYGGLKEGDILAIYNVDHVWEGEACESRYLMAQKNPVKPVAYGMVHDVAKNASSLLLMNNEAYPRMYDKKIINGAKVEVQLLVGKAKDRRLYRTMEIRSVVGAEISYEGGNKVDISPHLRDQIDAIAHDYGYMVYKP